MNSALNRELHSPHGWPWCSVGKDHHSDCQPVLFPIPLWCREWLDRFASRSASDEHVFPSTKPTAAALSQAPMSETWNASLAAANVDRRLIPSEGSGDKIDVRKFAANWWHLAALKSTGDKKLADDVSFYVLHHAEVTTARRHYLVTQAAVLPLLIDLLPEFTLPGAQSSGLILFTAFSEGNVWPSLSVFAFFPTAVAPLLSANVAIRPPLDVVVPDSMLFPERNSDAGAESQGR